MKDIQPANIPIPKTDSDDPRIGHFLNNPTDTPKVVLIGFPSDEGVKRNAGRPGAAGAPDEIRKVLYKLTPGVENRERFINLLNDTSDIGNVKVTGDLEADQEVLGNIVAEYLRQNIIPVILGGGHGTSFGHFLGYAKAGFQTSIFNLDAHTDVRPLKKGKAHSGSPFRQAIEHESGSCLKYTVVGLQPHSTAKAHIKYVEKHEGKAIFRDNTNEERITNQLVNNLKTMVTFDMDAVDQAFAPGVSAPCANGLNPQLWLKAAYLSGKNSNVSSFDISEVNPKYDGDGQTVRLAALTVWYFLKGLSERE